MVFRGGMLAAAVFLAAVLSGCADDEPDSDESTTPPPASNVSPVPEPSPEYLPAGDLPDPLSLEDVGGRTIAAKPFADFAVGAKGARTPERAAGVSSLKPGERMVVSVKGTRVWILRPDGTARETMHLTRMRGWLMHMRESCA